MNEVEITTRIESFVRDAFDVAPSDPNFGLQVDLFEHGYVDSVGLTELLAFLGDEFGVDVPDEYLLSDEFATISGMARVLIHLADR